MSIATPNLSATEERRVADLTHKAKVAAAMEQGGKDPREWTYEGEIIDAGHADAHCTCGHPIRYVFPITHPSGSVLPIGSVCIAETVSYLIASGAEGLAESLRAAVERLKERQAEEARRVRDAANDLRVAALAEYLEDLRRWRRAVRKAIVEEADRRGRRPWFNEPFYSELKQVTAKSTPGRTAAALLKRIQKFHAQVLEYRGQGHPLYGLGKDFPEPPESIRAEVLERFAANRA